jgi:thiamine pyrophosphate-dependent acetolactate synthase large subunit-like protein
VAEGLGAVGYRVDRLEDLASTLQAALACGRPAVVDVAIDPTLEPPMAGRAAATRRFEQRG